MKKLPVNEPDADGLQDRLGKGGLRVTPQREHVYTVLLGKKDHPTAEEVFIRAKKGMPEISMATVYNCLDTLAKCGLVRQVNVERAATRFCPNMEDHCHFYCDECGGVFDIKSANQSRRFQVALPPGFKASHYETSIRGVCAECSGK